MTQRQTIGGHESRWMIVESRDSRFDGKFVYAVSSTGIYCRPSCPSRRPRPQHVRFFETAATAEEAGFRACRRCRPSNFGPDRRIQLVTRACRFLNTTPDACSVGALAARLRSSPDELRRVFSSIIGIAPLRLISAYRLRRFKQRVRRGAALTDAMYEAGYGSSSRLYEHAVAELGMTPATYRRGGAGETIRYAVTACDAGTILVGVTARGICTVAVGEDGAALRRQLVEEYPAAIVRSEPSLLSNVNHACERSMLGSDEGQLPPSVRAIAFQLRVWAVLRSRLAECSYIVNPLQSSREKSMVQLVSQVLPPSTEKACSQRA